MTDSNETDRANEASYLLLSVKYSKDHLIWWGPKSCGYTSDIDKAGRYTKAEADGICRGHADDVVHVPVASVEPLVCRVVSGDHLTALRAAARACLVGGCGNFVEGDGDECAACIEGQKGPIHLPAYRDEEGGTSCGKIIDGARTYRDRHPIEWSCDEIEKATCEECKRKHAEQKAEWDRTHWDGCEGTYCEGCKEAAE